VSATAYRGDVDNRYLEPSGSSTNTSITLIRRRCSRMNIVSAGTEPRPPRLWLEAPSLEGLRRVRRMVDYDSGEGGSSQGRSPARPWPVPVALATRRATYADERSGADVNDPLPHSARLAAR
jgi:hypothetical protein